MGAGPGPWLDDATIDGVDRLVMAFSLAGGMIVAAGVVAAGAYQLDRRWSALAFAGALATLIVVAFAPLPARLPVGPAGMLALRTGAGVGILALSVRAYGSVQPLVVATFGVPAGAHAVVTLRAVGVRLAWGRALRGVFLSTVHAGVLMGAAILALLPGTQALRSQGVNLGLAFYGLVVTSWATATGLSVLVGRIEQDQEGRLSSMREALHRDLSHWLHDDVCSELGYLRLRLQEGLTDPRELRRSLDELDHELRVRQVHQIIEGGPARVGEIMQPYLRAAQANGVVLAEVPSFDSASTLLPPPVARQVQRAMAVLMANAIQAGADRIAIRTSLAGDDVVVEIDDDAGGFDVALRMPGRGLDVLERELGAGRLEMIRSERGTLARVRISRSPAGVSA